MFHRLLSLLLLSLALVQALPAAAKEGDAAFSVSPDSAFIGLTTAIMEAKSSLDINIYMFTSKNIANVLAKKAEQGVKIRVLVEGEPHGGTVFPAVKQTLDQLHESFKGRGKNAKLYVMMAKDGSAKRRYVYNHAKYAVIDGKKIFVSSDNFTGSAFPDPSRTIWAGGTRGWQVLLENSAVAGELGRIFEEDVSGKADVLPYEKANLRVSDPSNGPLPKRDRRTAKSFGIELGRSGKSSICASPLSESCVLDFIRSAKSELLVEHLSFPFYWKPFANGKLAKTGPVNPIVAEIIAAARRGVKVKVLVNDDRAFEDDDSGKEKDEELSNRFAVNELNKLAAKERLPLEAAIFSGPGTQTNYLHNKGMIADGKRVFVSSINGTQNSVENNREIAVAIDTEDGARYFGEVFGFDWENRQR